MIFYLMKEKSPYPFCEEKQPRIPNLWKMRQKTMYYFGCKDVLNELENLSVS